MGCWYVDVIDSCVNYVELVEWILDEFGYIVMWQNDKNLDVLGCLDNLKELIKVLEEFDNFQGFFEYVVLVMDIDKGEQVEEVSIMMLYVVKGLEYFIVFLSGWEDGLFFSQCSMDEFGIKGFEEECCFGYVGIMWGEELVIIIFVGNCCMYG